MEKDVFAEPSCTYPSDSSVKGAPYPGFLHRVPIETDALFP